MPCLAGITRMRASTHFIINAYLYGQSVRVAIMRRERVGNSPTNSIVKSETSSAEGQQPECMRCVTHLSNVLNYSVQDFICR